MPADQPPPPTGGFGASSGEMSWQASPWPERNSETQRVHVNPRRGAGHIVHSSASPMQTRYSACLRSVRPRTVRPPALSHRRSCRHHTTGGSPALTCLTSVELHAAAGPTLYAHDVTAAHWCTASGRLMHLATAPAYRATLPRSIASHSSAVYRRISTFVSP